KDGIRDRNVTGVQTCALPISRPPVANPFGSFTYGIFLTPNLEAILLKFLMTPLLITVEIMNLTGFFAISRTLSQALPIASLPFSKAFGTDLVIAFFSGLNTLSRMKFHTVRILVLIPFHTFLTTVRKKRNFGARCALIQFTIGWKMYFLMNAQATRI